MGEESTTITEYGAIKLNRKTLEDATLNLGSLPKGNKNFANKGVIMKALADVDIPLLRQISNYFYRTSGIYQRVCNYFAQLYRYDWYIDVKVYGEKYDEKKILTEFDKVMSYLDNSYIKKLCGDIALAAIKDGAYYGYIIDGEDGLILQELPIGYCRSYYNVGHLPAIEFNMRYFDDCFTDIEYRKKVLKMFPAEFSKGYLLYKAGKLTSNAPGDSSKSGWYLLEPGQAIKFSFNNGDIPLFINACPAILDLDAAQDMDRRKQMQKLLKIIVQKLPLDKNGDLIFDVEEARDIHKTAVQMLRNAIGLDVLTTFTDVEAIDLSDKNTTTSTDDLQKVERTVYNAFGTASSLFNTDGNIALQNSILNDESYMRSMLLQFSVFFDTITRNRATNPKRFKFRFHMLETTQYNYRELSKMYKEQMNSGFSKILCQVALGHSQSSIIDTLFFENEILHLSEMMIPPLMSSTLNGEDILGRKDQRATQKNQDSTDGENKGGRPEKPDEEKSEKTIQNIESQG